MDFGVGVRTTVYSWKVIKRAEELGFTHAWSSDTPMLTGDPFVGLATAAVHTSKIHLGTSVIVPSNWVAPTLANALATLNALAPGRIEFGVGTGFTARRALGLPALPLAEVERFVQQVQGLLAGETIDWSQDGGEPKKVRFMVPDRELINLKDPIGLHMSAFGPKARALTAKLGAGWIAGGEIDASGRPIIDTMRAAWVEAGRDPATLYAINTISGAILRDGETADSDRVKALVGPSPAMMMHDYAEAKALRPITRGPPPMFQEQFDRYAERYQNFPEAERHLYNHRGHLMFLKPEEEDLITGEMIRMYTATGERPQILDRLRRLKANGYSQISISLPLGQEIETAEEWADLFAEI